MEKTFNCSCCKNKIIPRHLITQVYEDSSQISTVCTIDLMISSAGMNVQVLLMLKLGDKYTLETILIVRILALSVLWSCFVRSRKINNVETKFKYAS